MIFVSSASLKEKNLNKLLNNFKKNKISRVELSGGTEFNNEVSSIIKKYNKNMKFTLHNYFPPPKKEFILNLGSLDERNRQDSLKLCKRAINICKKHKITKYAVHAPFLIDFTPDEAGKLIKKRTLANRKKVIIQFIKSWKELKKLAGNKVDLYIENNVLSFENYKNFNFKNPFLLTDYKSYLELKKKIDFKILLDFGHLFVSCKTLNKKFQKEANKLTRLTDYFHISDNNGIGDQNKGLIKNSEIFKFLKQRKIKKNSTVTLEIYQSINIIKKNIKIINKLI